MNDGRKRGKNSLGQSQSSLGVRSSLRTSMQGFAPDISALCADVASVRPTQLLLPRDPAIAHNDPLPLLSEIVAFQASCHKSYNRKIRFESL